MAGDLSILLDADAKELFQTLQQAQNKIAEFAGKAQQEGEKAGQGFVSRFKSGFGGLGKNLFEGIAALGIGSQIKDLADYGSKIQDLHDRFGVSTTSLQEFGNAAEQNGSSLEAVARAFRFLEVNQSKALGGNQGMVKAFEELGISAQDLQTLKPEQIFEKMGHSSLNAADFVKVLGKSALELRPLVAGIADGTIQLGGAIDALDIKRLDELHDRMKQLHETVTIGLGTSLAKATAAWQVLVADMTGGALALFEEIKGVASGIGTSFSSAFDASKLAATTFAEVASDVLHGRFVEAFEAAKKEPGKVTEILKKGVSDATSEVAKGHEAAKSALQGAALAADELVTGEGEKKPRDFGLPPDESETGQFDDQGRPISKKEKGELSRETEKLAATENERYLKSLSFEERIKTLRAEAEATLEKSKASATELERVELKNQYYDIVKQIEAEENSHAAVMTGHERERTREKRDQLGVAKDKRIVAGAPLPLLEGQYADPNAKLKSDDDPSLALAIKQGEERRLAASKPIPGGRTAGVGESQELVNEQERNRLAAEKTPVSTDLAGAARDHAEFAKEQAEKAAKAKHDRQLNYESGLIENQLDHTHSRMDLAQRNKDYGADLARAMNNHQTERELHLGKAPSIEVLLQKIATNTQGAGANK